MAARHKTRDVMPTPIIFDFFDIFPRYSLLIIAKGGILKTLERCWNDVRYLKILSNVRLLFSNVRYLTSFRRLSDVYKIPPYGLKLSLEA